MLQLLCDQQKINENAARRIYTFSSHANFETFLKATILALVPMMLVDGTVATSAARVGQVTSNGAFEEALASLARELSVMLPGALVAADNTLNARLFAAITAAAAAATRRSSEGRTRMVLMMMLACAVVVGATGSSACTVHAADADVGTGLLQLVRSRETVNCAER